MADFFDRGPGEDLAIPGLKLDYRQTLIKALELNEIYSYDQDFDKVEAVARVEP